MDMNTLVVPDLATPSRKKYGKHRSRQFSPRESFHKNIKFKTYLTHGKANGCQDISLNLSLFPALRRFCKRPLISIKTLDDVTCHPRPFVFFGYTDVEFLQ